MMIRKLRDVTIDIGPKTIYDPQLGVHLVLGGATLLFLLLLVLPLLDLQHDEHSQRFQNGLKECTSVW